MEESILRTNCIKPCSFDSQYEMQVEKTDLSYMSGPGYAYQPPVMAYGCTITEVSRVAIGDVLGKLTASVQGALNSADDAVREQLRASAKQAGPAEEAGPVEWSSLSPSSLRRKLAERHISYLKISEADKALYQTFKGAKLKGKSMLDMLGITGAEKQLLDQLDSDNKKLLKAARAAEYDKAKLLLLGGADPNTYDVTRENSTPLMFASAVGHRKIVLLLLIAKAEVNDKNLVGRTALMEAAENGHLKVVKELVKAGAEIMITDRSDKTALSLAHDKGHAEVVKFLQSAIEKALCAADSKGIKADVGVTSQSADLNENVSQSTELVEAAGGMPVPSKEPATEAGFQSAEASAPIEVASSPISLKLSEICSEESYSSGDSDQVVPDVSKREESE